MIKKLLVLGLALVMIIGCTACGSSVKSMSYDDYDLSEYIEVGDYKGLKVAPYTVSVSDDEIDADIKSTLAAATTQKELGKDAEIKKGDIVNIDYVGKKDGNAFDGGSAEGYDLTIGSGTFIPGFEDGLIGKKTGETVDLKLTFPKDYSNAELAGQDVVFTVTINKVKRSKTPKVEDYAKDNGYESVEAYRKATKKKLKNQKEEQAIQDQKQTVWSEALEKVKVKDYPQREVDNYIAFNSAQIDTYAKTNNVSREELLKQYGFNSEEDFAAVNEDSSKLRVKQEMLIEWIADKEGLECTDEEMESMLKQMQDGGYDEDAIAEQTGRTAKDYIHIEVLYEKVLDFLMKNAKITGTAKTY